MIKEKSLLFDIGGTWTRFAFFDGKKINSPKSVATSNFKLEDIKIIMQNKNISKIIIACAGPVIDGKCKMTNANLTFDERALSQLLKVKVIVINDFVAVAQAFKKKSGTLIIGPGTGLGVSIISNKGKIISSEEGHLKIKRELFLNIPEFKHVLIPEYEQILAGKNNLLLKLLKKEKITLIKDRFTEIYCSIFESFIQELLEKHSDEKIKTIMIRGGIIVNNKTFFTQYIKILKKKTKKEIKIINDDFIGLKGAIDYI